jgi:hypothetical protein
VTAAPCGRVRAPAGAEFGYCAARTFRQPTAPRRPTHPTHPMQSTQSMHATHATHRRQRMHANVATQLRMPAPSTVSKLPTTPTLVRVPALPATATLATVAALPATATLPAVDTDPETATLRVVAALPATAALPVTLALPTTATLPTTSWLPATADGFRRRVIVLSIALRGSAGTLARTSTGSSRLDPDNPICSRRDRPIATRATYSEGIGRGRPGATVRARIPSVARRLISDKIGKIARSFHTGSIRDQS